MSWATRRWERTLAPPAIASLMGALTNVIIRQYSNRAPLCDLGLSVGNVCAKSIESFDNTASGFSF